MGISRYSVGFGKNDNLPATPTIGTPPGAVKKKPRLGRTIRRTLAITFLSWMGMWGGSNAYSEVVGDGPMPAIYNASAQEKQAARQNTTMQFYNSMILDGLIRPDGSIEPPTKTNKGNKRTASKEEWWAALKPTRDLLKSVVPEVDAWLTRMYETDRISFVSHPKHGDLECSQLDLITGHLTINRWILLDTDGGKAAIIAHEYRHSRQNTGKVINHLISPKRIIDVYRQKAFESSGQAPSADGGTSIEGDITYGSVIEDEAYGFQHQIGQALGMASGAEQYLSSRNR